MWVPYIIEEIASLGDVLRFLRRTDPELIIRIYGNRDLMFRSGLKQGCLGYLYIYSPKAEGPIYYHRFKRKKLGFAIPESSMIGSEVMKQAFTVDEIEETPLIGESVLINSGEYRCLKGVVTREHHGPNGREVDVMISCMTLTRIITLPKEQVRPTDINV